MEITGTPTETIDASMAQLLEWVVNPPADLAAADVDRLAAARSQLIAAMSPERWVNETTLDPALGRRVFVHLRRAVKQLGKMSRGTSIHDAKNDIKKSLVNVSELLAQVAYEQAVANGVGQANLDRALAKMAKADRKQAARRWKKAINANRRSWIVSVRHLVG